VTRALGLRPESDPLTWLPDRILSDSLSRADALSAHYTLMPGRPRGRHWVPLPSLADPAGARTALRRVEDRYGGGPGLAASFLATWVAGLVAYPLVAGVFAERRLLRPPAEALWLRWDRTGDFFDAMAVERAAVTVLPGDPMVEFGAAADGLDRLQDDLMRTYVDLLEPVLTTIVEVGRRGRRALWADAVDRIAGWYLLIGQDTEDAERAVAEADATVASASSPGPACSRWLHVDGRTFKRRAVCCLAYRSPRFSDQYCATCPLLSENESVRRLTES
jgi:ferric iron reductase protein FhuF